MASNNMMTKRNAQVQLDTFDFPLNHSKAGTLHRDDVKVVVLEGATFVEFERDIHEVLEEYFIHEFSQHLPDDVEILRAMGILLTRDT